VVVVLILLGLGAALVAPALVAPSGPSATLQRILIQSQELAMRRAETVVLEVTAAGEWTVFGASSEEEGALAQGELEGDPPPQDFSLRIAPTGSCGLDLKTDTGPWRPDLDLVTCRLLTP